MKILEKYWYELLGNFIKTVITVIQFQDIRPFSGEGEPGTLMNIDRSDTFGRRRMDIEEEKYDWTLFQSSNKSLQECSGCAAEV